MHGSGRPAAQCRQSNCSAEACPVCAICPPFALSNRAERGPTMFVPSSPTLHDDSCAAAALNRRTHCDRPPTSARGALPSRRPHASWVMRTGVFGPRAMCLHRSSFQAATSAHIISIARVGCGGQAGPPHSSNNPERAGNPQARARWRISFPSCDGNGPGAADCGRKHAFPQVAIATSYGVVQQVPQSCPTLAQQLLRNEFRPISANAGR